MREILNKRFYFLYLHLLQTRIVNEFGKVNIEFYLNKIMLIERWYGYLQRKIKILAFIIQLKYR